jgi:hypothetical protein
LKAIRLFFGLTLVTVSAMASGPFRLSPQHTTTSTLCNEESYEIYCGGSTYENCCGTLNSCLDYCAVICGGPCELRWELGG